MKLLCMVIAYDKAQTALVALESLKIPELQPLHQALNNCVDEHRNRLEQIRHFDQEIALEGLPRLFP